MATYLMNIDRKAIDTVVKMLMSPSCFLLRLIQVACVRLMYVEH